MQIENTQVPSSENPILILLVDDEIAEYRALKQRMKTTSDFVIDTAYAPSIDSAVEQTLRRNFQLILVDNRLLPNNDFRETVPRLRGIGYTGPIGVVSSNITAPYFQEFPEFGVDFRMGKDEIDYHSIRHIIGEYVKYDAPDELEDI